MGERLDAGRERGKGVVTAGRNKRKTTDAGHGSGRGGGGGGKRGFYLGLAVLAVAGIGTLSYLSTRRSDDVTTVDSTIAPIPNQGHVMGSESAPLEIVEFADFECPACGSFATLTEPDIRERLVKAGTVRFRFMDFPLSMHANTWPAHRAAWCAGEQGKFWEMHDAIFQNQDRWNGEATRRPDGVLAGIARQVGVNMDQYDSCVRTRKYQAQIQANVDEAIRRGVGRTPTFYIGNKMVDGALPYDALKRHVDEALAQARKPAK
jgi:protein-disulfide isomerase